MTLGQKETDRAARGRESGRMLELSLKKACRLDVIACKPGNVSLNAAGHGMTAADFLLSARACVPHLVRTDISVGEIIYTSVAATRAAVGCNTNLGIILLLAPLARTVNILMSRGHGDASGRFRATLAEVLESLTVDDTRWCFEAIRTARPAGLGQAAANDVFDPPAAALKEVMRGAVERDSIARQYANAYSDVWDVGLSSLRTGQVKWGSLNWAATYCYIRLLASFPDSHIVRKWGDVVALDVQTRAGAMEKTLEACENPRGLAPRLGAFDRELKQRGLNPGTSADLTVASLACLLLLQNLENPSGKLRTPDQDCAA